jgi:hypothetical protein
MISSAARAERYPPMKRALPRISDSRDREPSHRRKALMNTDTNRIARDMMIATRHPMPPHQSDENDRTLDAIFLAVFCMTGSIKRVNDLETV